MSITYVMVGFLSSEYKSISKPCITAQINAISQGEGKGGAGEREYTDDKITKEERNRTNIYPKQTGEKPWMQFGKDRA